MHLLKTIMTGAVIKTGAAVALFTTLLFTVSAAEPSAGHCVNVLEGSGMEKAIATMETYETSNSGLAEAYRENGNTSLGHSLTTDGLEDGTMETASESPAGEETYNSPGIAVQGNDNSVNSANAADREAVAAEIDNSSIAAGGSSVNTAAGTPTGNGSAVASNTGSGSAVAGNTGSDSVTPAADTPDSNEAAVAGGTSSNKTYHHTTSVYADDNVTLIRVEYYNDNNKLSEYSEVTNYDAGTGSYTETVYSVDDDLNSCVTRTDTYVNGELTSSENP